MPAGIYVRQVPRFNRPPIIKVCPYCGKEFTIPHNRYKKIFCSVICANKHTRGLILKRGSRTKVEIVCMSCGKIFSAPRSNNRKFCSYECYQHHKEIQPKKVKIEIHTCQKCGKKFKVKNRSSQKYCYYCGHSAGKIRNFIGRKKVNQGGYVEIYLGIGDELAYGDGWALEHRVVVSKQMGRPLTKSEVVHHLDGNRLNNDPCNLQLLTPVSHRVCRYCSLQQENTVLKKKIDELEEKIKCQTLKI